MGLFSGGMERLGFVPVLALLYVQFKDWKLGDWGAFAKINAVGAVLLWGLLLSYLASWWGVSRKTRVDPYESLLREALA